MSAFSQRAKPKDFKGNEVLRVEYLGKVMRACIILGANERDMDDAQIPEGSAIHMNFIVDRSVVIREVREILSDAKDGDHILLMCRTFNIRKDVLAALGFAEGSLTA